MTGKRKRRQIVSSPQGSRINKMESLVMRDRLRVSFWGLHLDAEGIVAIAAAILIVSVVLLASRL